MQVVILPFWNDYDLNVSLIFRQISAQLTSHTLLVEMTAAKESDQADLVVRFDTLAQNDHLILNALQDGDQRVRRLEDLVIAFTKVSLLCIYKMLANELYSAQYRRRAGNPNNKKTDVFIQSATSALQRVSNTDNTMEIPHWSLTSLEVTIDRSGEGVHLGSGSFGCVYKGDWKGQVSQNLNALDSASPAVVCPDSSS
jgi:hypothetical protein